MHRNLRFGFPLFCLCILAVTWVSVGRAQYLNCTTPASAPDSLFVQNLAPPYTDENLASLLPCVKEQLTRLAAICERLEVVVS